MTEIPHLDEVVREGRALRNLQKELREAILTDHPEFDEETVVDYQTLIRYKVSCYESVFESDSEQYKRLHEEILRSIQENETITETTLSADIDDDLPLGQRAADKIAKFGGSWPFITLFMSVLLAWVVTNTFALIGENFDPYPYVLLNLGLSCLAAIQAPIIMMSQNRQADRDRQRELNDYKINLKSEIEIKLLHEKIDYLLQHPWNHMTEIQSFQAELLQDLQHEVKDLKLVVHKHIINDT